MMFLRSEYRFTLLVAIFCSIACQSCWSYKLASLPGNSVHINPNMRCPGKNEDYIWHPCKHGGYIENPDPKNCADRYVCYKGVNETCYSGEKCAYNAICTVCGLCQKCDSAENCSDFELCPNINGFNAINFIKRLVQNRSNALNIQ